MPSAKIKFEEFLLYFIITLLNYQRNWEQQYDHLIESQVLQNYLINHEQDKFNSQLKHYFINFLKGKGSAKHFLKYLKSFIEYNKIGKFYKELN